MTYQQQARYLADKYNVDFFYALKILRENDYSLMLAGAFFRDMQREVNNETD